MTLPYIGSQIHVVSAVLLALILWLRLCLVGKSIEKTIDTLESVEKGNVEGTNENI